jgi:hypothetical protein
MERHLTRQNTAPAGRLEQDRASEHPRPSFHICMKNNIDFQGPNAAALPAGGVGLLDRTAAPASTLSRPAGVPALKIGAAAAGTGS